MCDLGVCVCFVCFLSIHLAMNWPLTGWLATCMFVVFSYWLLVQVEHAKVCEEYEDQMKELEEILAAGPAALNISVEQLAKQVCIMIRMPHTAASRAYMVCPLAITT